MASRLTEEDIDDLIYFSRAGETDRFVIKVDSLAERLKVSAPEILTAVRDERRATCLHMAAANRRTGIVEYILNHLSTLSRAGKKAAVDAPNESGSTALHWAALLGHLEVVQMLVVRGNADPGAANAKDEVPLDLAKSMERQEVVEWFQEQAEMTEEKEVEVGLLEVTKGMDLDEEIEVAGDVKDGKGVEKMNGDEKLQKEKSWHGWPF